MIVNEQNEQQSQSSKCSKWHNLELHKSSLHAACRQPSFSTFASPEAGVVRALLMITIFPVKYLGRGSHTPVLHRGLCQCRGMHIQDNRTSTTVNGSFLIQWRVAPNPKSMSATHWHPILSQTLLLKTFGQPKPSHVSAYPTHQQGSYSGRGGSLVRTILGL